MLVKPEVVDRRLDRLVADAVHAVLGGTLVLDEMVVDRCYVVADLVVAFDEQ